MTTADIWSASSGSVSDPIVVLVHGSMDRSAGLLRLSRRLDDKFRVFRYDRRGYGRSVDNHGPYTMSDQVGDLAALLAEWAPSEHATLVFGHSYGGNIALALADQHPELVTAVSVYEAPLTWLEWWPNNSAGGAALAAPDPGDAAEAFMRRLLGDAAWEQLPASKRETRRAEGAAMLGELADLRAHEPWAAGRVKVPVLAMYGENGRPHHRQAMEGLSGILNDCRFKQIDGAAHVGPNSHPDRVAECLVEFIESVG